MQKMDGKICDNCRTMFYSGDRIVELCEDCANTVWCVFNEYEDGTRRLSSIHRTEEKAIWWIEHNKKLIETFSEELKNKPFKQTYESWGIL